MSEPTLPCAACGRPIPRRALLNVCAGCAFEEASLPAAFPRVEGFDILGLAGEGAMGRVYRAWQRMAERTVALKVMKRGLSGRAEHRFREEVRLLSSLDHPNVATVHTAGLMEGGGHWMAMGWIDGVPLSRWLAAEKPSMAGVVRVMREVGLGVQAAHALPVVHRDLKPGNILVGDGGRTVRVVDFGVAQDIRETRDASGPDAGAPPTREGAVVGTLDFLSPEQARSRPAGPASDVFSLGIILFWSLTGRHPFLEPGITGEYDRLRRMAEGRTAVFPKDGPVLPKDLRAVILKALEPEPERRYGTAGELAADLSCWLENRPVRARRSGAAWAVWKWVRRHPGRTAAAAAAVLAAAGSGAWHLHSRELAARNLRDQLAETRLVAAELAGQRGQWRESLRLLDLAERAGARNTVRVTLAKVEALVSSGRRAEASALLDGLPAGASGGPGRAGLPDFWRAQVREGVSGIPEASALLRRAVTAGLPPAEHLIARAVITDDAGETLRLLEQAVREHPMQHQALALCSLAQLFTGRAEEAGRNLEAAVRLFPDSAELPKYRMLVLASMGGKESAGDPQVRMLQEIFQAGSQIYDIAWGRAGPGLPLLAMGRVLSADYGGVPSVALKFMWDARSREVRGIMSALSPFTSEASRVEALEAAMADPHPSPLLLMGLSLMLTDSALTDTALLTRLEKACRLGCEAPFVNRQCQALLLENTAAVLIFHAVKGTDPGAPERALTLARRRLEITEIPTAPAAAEVISGGCLKLGEPGLARQYAEAALREKPGLTDAAWYLARAEMESGNWQRCLQLLDSLPAGARPEADVLQLRGAARGALTKYLDQRGPPAGETPAPAPPIPPLK